MKYEFNLLVSGKEKKVFLESIYELRQYLKTLVGVEIVVDEFLPHFDIFDADDIEILARHVFEIASCGPSESGNCRGCSLENVDNCKAFLAETSARALRVLVQKLKADKYTR